MVLEDKIIIYMCVCVILGFIRLEVQPTYGFIQPDDGQDRMFATALACQMSSKFILCGGP